MKDIKKLLEQEDDSMLKSKLDLKKRALKELSKEMGMISGGSILEQAMAPKAKVMVATDDPSKLPEALEKAKEIAEELPEMEESEEMEEKEEEEEMEESEEEDIENMSPEQLKEMILKLKKK